MGAAETKQYAERMDKQIKVALKNRKADGRKKDISLNQKDLQDLFEQIAFEYPYFDSIADSAIMTDHQLPDEPIIYCNDEFTALTGYPKEDILGRNCRFLQGKYTDPKHVDKIRNALKSGTKLEIELLNYRRDGTPFINGFLMLPLHKKGKTDGVVTHFLAVQKNVTVLVNPWKQPMNQWTVPEVCMWLEKNESPSYIKQFLAKDVDGKKLSAMSWSRSPSWAWR
jgi:PAS domain S-box-containing protein